MPHASDSFPHVDGMLPQETAVAANGIERKPRRTRRRAQEQPKSAQIRYQFKGKQTK
ncbi:MAG: hypothetical protein GY796_17315 [Chloroflexi bacterium]|nr:hypothetical protein [Chloroflexota bacterium]